MAWALTLGTPGFATEESEIKTVIHDFMEAIVKQDWEAIGSLMHPATMEAFHEQKLRGFEKYPLNDAAREDLKRVLGVEAVGDARKMSAKDFYIKIMKASVEEAAKLGETFLQKVTIDSISIAKGEEQITADVAGKFTEDGQTKDEVRRMVLKKDGNDYKVLRGASPIPKPADDKSK